ncbi:MAG: hypothetical protein SWE60_01380 [Thermodesulfobacteriota bacterium]|nr:hypothetical protein [Thermodesulfobacteriota bacterium]
MSQRALFIHPQLRQALGLRGYSPPMLGDQGWRYLHNAKPVFFLYYDGGQSTAPHLPEIHILSAKLAADLGPQCKTIVRTIMTNCYTNYLRNIGKDSFVPNVIVQPEGMTLCIKQPTRDNPDLVAMTWDDIQDIVLNLHLVNHDAPMP